VLRRYLAREIEHWSRNGLLEPGQGERLLADHDRRHTGFSLSGVLAVLAAVLFGAAVIALVAANWEFIPRMFRVALIAALIVTGIAVAVIARRRASIWISDSALIFTLLTYGAGIALISQMYHMSGDERGFMLIWSLAALVVALGFSSPSASSGAGLLGLGYLYTEVAGPGLGTEDIIHAGQAVVTFAIAMGCGLAAWRARSVSAGHLAAILLVLWCLWVGHNAAGIAVEHMLIALGALAFAAGAFAPPGLVPHMERHGAVSAYGAVMLFSGLAILQVDLGTPGLALEILVAAIILLGSIVVLMVSGRANRLIRRVAYFTFAAETLYVVSETLGSLLGSSGFLFLSGLSLAAIAFLVMKIEKRFKAGQERA
jgi:uncharacterized membrane protein